MAAPSDEELEAAFCWEADDQIPRRPAMTTFRREARYRQALWREANHHPIGTQPIVPKPGAPARPVGSRLPLEYARDTGANFLTSAALTAARARTSYIEPRQSIDHQRLWADLVSSHVGVQSVRRSAGDRFADRALHRWFPTSRRRELRFAHRLVRPRLPQQPAFVATMFVPDPTTAVAIVAVDVKYHERNKSELRGPRTSPDTR